MGTTLEILAPYLPHGIDVHWLPLTQATAKLTAERIGTNGLTIEQMYFWPYAECLPVLRSFDQLCTPLKDGTVPASKLAEGWDMGAGVLFLYDENGTLEYEAHEDGLFATMYYEGNRQRFTEQHSWPAAFIDHLRAMHFAAPGMREGIDYIRKA